MSDAVKVFEIYVKASPERVWTAITTSDWTAHYGYKAPSHYDLRPGGRFIVLANEQMRAMGMAEIIIDGEVAEADPPKRLVQTYRFLFSSKTQEEGFTRLSWDIAALPAGFTRLTVTHDLGGAPIASGMVSSKVSPEGGGGWSFILSDLKSLLETGSTLEGAEHPPPSP
jgi:uncharacterized protein YndB with AHSA1/START domain